MTDLYHNRVLELAASIPHLAPLPDAEGEAEKVSRVCGSVVSVAVRLNPAGTHVEAVSVNPKACALGQAATAILAEHAPGAAIEEIVAARDALRAMLKENAPPPAGRFWELRHLAGVADYPPRHTSTLLAFEAAVAAINAALAARAGTPAAEARPGSAAG